MVGEEGGNLSPPPRPFLRHHRSAQWRRAGLALANSGGLCSPQLFPGRLTCQLLGKRCC